MNLHPTLNDIKLAYSRIKPFIHNTPVLSSSLINELSGCQLFFKAENFQKVGAFKYRGATNAILKLIESKVNLSGGVATHSSGNHAQALALAAKVNGIRATIVMPSNSPKVKSDAVLDYGAEIVFCEPNLAARESTLEKVINETGAYLIHPYQNIDVICGQGTATIELMEEIEDLDIIISPVGGGGLLSGTLIAAKGIKLSIKVYAAEPEGASDAMRGIQSGVRVESHTPNTICDGLLTTLGDINFEIIKDKIDEILIINDNEVKHALKLIYERMKIIIEPSSATVLAAVIRNPEVFAGKRVGLILSGGNVDLNNFKDWF